MRGVNAADMVLVTPPSLPLDRRAPTMTLMRPMLATPGRHIPAGDGWSHEVKWDGIRVLADCRSGLDRFLSRNGNDVTAAWPDLASSPFPGATCSSTVR